jgi:aryl-alcohol dehydrogenase-like predicted oxidoreductase
VHRAEFEREPAEVCRAYGLGVLPYSPLAAGFLTGKYRKGEQPQSDRARTAKRYFSDRNFALLDRMQEMGEKLGGCSISQVALAWLLGDPLVTSPIIGPRSLEQLEDNLGAAGLRLPPEDRQVLSEATQWKD